MSEKFRVKRIVLHPGLPKTGTTSIQNALSRCRNTLYDSYKILYPGQGVSQNLAIGTAFASDPRRLLQHRLAGRANLEELQKEGANVLQEWEEEIDLKRPELVILSGETVSNFSLSELKALSAWMATNSESVEVFFVIRNPLAHSTSLIQQALKQGRTLSELYETPIVPNLARKLSNVIESFGRDNVCLGVFEELCKSNGGLVGSFIDHVGIPKGSVWNRIVSNDTRENQSLSMPAAILLDAINRHRPAFVNQEVGPKRTFTEVRYLRQVPGPRFSLPPLVVEKILQAIKPDVVFLNEKFGVNPYPNLQDWQPVADPATHFDDDTIDAIALLISDLINEAERRKGGKAKRNYFISNLRKLLTKLFF